MRSSTGSTSPGDRRPQVRPHRRRGPRGARAGARDRPRRHADAAPDLPLRLPAGAAPGPVAAPGGRFPRGTRGRTPIWTGTPKASRCARRRRNGGACPPMPSRTRRRRARRVRPEIQALRAIAVGARARLPPVAGGAAAAASSASTSSSPSPGFLITSLLLREIERTGPRLAAGLLGAPRAADAAGGAADAARLRGGDGRARPADLLAAVLRRDAREHGVRRRTGSSPRDAVDYLAADNAPSPVQHFWSLSVEEQFYLVWPLLIAVALGRHAAARGRRRAARWSALVLALRPARAWSTRCSDTAADPAAAYFVTPTRAWEFGAGGAARARRAVDGRPPPRAPRCRGSASPRSRSRRSPTATATPFPGHGRAAARARRARGDRAPARRPAAGRRRGADALRAGAVPRRHLLLGLPLALAAARLRAVRRRAPTAPRTPGRDRSAHDPRRRG